MKCRYETRLVAACPANGDVDLYFVAVESDAMVPCERILEEVRKLTGVRRYQEDITSVLAEALACRVTTVGYHSGVKTTVEAP